MSAKRKRPTAKRRPWNPATDPLTFHVTQADIDAGGTGAEIVERAVRRAMRQNGVRVLDRVKGGKRPK